MPAEPDYVTITAQFMLALLMLAVLVAAVRLVLGPSVPDRVVALDLVATLLVGVIAVQAIATAEAVLLRVAEVVALINFVGTVAYAYYLQKRAEE